MTFCDRCGSYMKETAKGMLCPRCGRLLPSATKAKPTPEIAENKRNKSIYVVEEDKASLVWKTLERFEVTKHQEFAAVQRFKDHAELLAKVKVQGDAAVQRIEKFRGRLDITIPMTYELALVRFDRRHPG